MILFRSIYASLILSGCCITAAGLSSPSIAGEIDADLEPAGSESVPLAYPVLLGLTSGTCLGLMARLNAAQHQLQFQKSLEFSAENSWSPMQKTATAPEFSEADLNDVGLAHFLEAMPEDFAEDVMIPAGLMAECSYR